MAGAILFGKLPRHGDFVSRGLDEAQGRAFDGWLSASFAEAAATPDFDGLYALAPAWRFRAAFAGHRYCGVLALSIDSVGRRFPVLVGVRGTSEGLAGACENVLYDAFAQGWDADALHSALDAIPDGAAPPDSAGDTWCLKDGEGTVVAALSGAYPPNLISKMIEAARLAQ